MTITSMSIKRFFLAVALSVATWAAASAYDYPYMNFVGNDDTILTLAVNEMTFEFSNGNMIVTNSAGEHTFALTEMKKMYFTESSGLSQLWEDVDENVEVFSESGVSMGRFKNTRQALQALESGVYIIKGETKTLKIALP